MYLPESQVHTVPGPEPEEVNPLLQPYLQIVSTVEVHAVVCTVAFAGATVHVVQGLHGSKPVAE
jgi:hypothetical protein